MANKHHKKFGKFQSDAFNNPMKTLLANIRFASIDDPIKTVVITSSVMDEGKSTTSSNLACAMASSGKRTLIVDADLRRRSLGSMLGMHNPNGLYSVLSGQASLRQAVSATEIPNLFFMDCEPNIANPADIFATRRFAVLMEKLRQSFDYVVFDMPPIGLFVDAAVASNLADGTILCVRQGFTKRDVVNKAISQLNAAEANILGIVMTFAEEAKNDYYYYYYYNEEGKKTRKHHDKDEGVLAQETPEEALDALSEDNIDSWMEQSGVDLVSEAEMQEAPARAPRRQAVPSGVEDPFAPGAFRKAEPGRAAGSGRGRHNR